MVEHIFLTPYHSGTGDILYKTPKFIYKVETSKLSNQQLTLVDTQYFALNEFRTIKESKPKYMADGSIIFKDTELVGAPEQFLIEHNYEEGSN